MPAPSPKQSLANTKAAPPTTATMTPPASTLWDFLGPWGNPSNLQPAGSAFPTPPAAPVQTQAGYPTSNVQSLRNALAMAVMGGGGGGGPGGGLPGETPEDRAALQWNLRNRGIHSYARPPTAAPSPTTTGSTAVATPAKAPTPTPRPPSGKGPPPQPPYNPLSSAYVPVGPPLPPTYDPLSSANTGLPAGEPVGGPRSWRPSWLTWG